MRRIGFRLFLFLAVATFAAYSALAKTPATKATTGYHQVAKWDVGGEGFWDYLAFDPGGKRLFLSRGTHVMVLNAVTGSVIGDIPDTGGVHGIALAPVLNKGFVSDGRDNAVTIFDLKTLKVLDKVKIEGENPDAILYEPGTKRVFTFNGRSKNVTALDAKTGKVLKTFDAGGKPEFAVADNGTIYGNLEDKGELMVIDPKAMAVKTRWSLSSDKIKCEGPSGLAVDTKTQRLFSVCDNKVMVVVNAKDGKLITSLPTGSGTDAAGFDPVAKLAFASNGEGTLTVVHEDSPDKFTEVENVKTLPRARTMAVDPASHRVFLVTAQFGPTPAPTAENKRPWPPMLPGTFTVLVFAK